MKIKITQKRILGVLLAIFIFYTQYLQYVCKPIPSMVSILGGVVILYGYLEIFSDKECWSPFKVTEFSMLALFFGVTFVTGILFSPDMMVHIKYWLMSFEYFLLVPCFMYLIKNKEDFFFFCALYLLLSLCCSFSLWHNPVVYYERAEEGVRYSLSTSLNVNMLGQFLSLGCWCCCVLMTFFRKFEKFGLILITILFYANSLTGSRKNLIAILLIVGTWYILCWMPNHRKNFLHILIVTVLIIILVGYCYTHIYLGSDMANRMNELVVSSDGKQNARIDMYKIAWGIFKNNPLFGLGFHGYGFFVGNINSYSHATYAEVIATTGLCGSILFLGMYIYSIIKIVINVVKVKRIVELEDTLILLKLALVLWFSILFMSIGVIYFYELFCFIIWGILFSMIQITSKRIENYFSKI